MINDGSSTNGVQAVLAKGLDEGCVFASVLEALTGALILYGHRLTVGCSARMKGRFVDSPGKGQAKEFKVEEVELLGESDAEVRPTRSDVP